MTLPAPWPRLRAAPPPPALAPAHLRASAVAAAGRLRKPTLAQAVVGVALSLLSWRVESILDDRENGPDVYMLTYIFFSLYLLMARRQRPRSRPPGRFTPRRSCHARPASLTSHPPAPPRRRRRRAQATQDIAVDGWALTLLSRRNVGLASTANAVGQTVGYFAAFSGRAVSPRAPAPLRSE